MLACAKENYHLQRSVSVLQLSDYVFSGVSAPAVEHLRPEQSDTALSRVDAAVASGRLRATADLF